MSSGPEKKPHDDNALRPHTYDGIQEFDKRLPNWWLLTLYATIVFSIVFWFVHYEARVVPSDGARVTKEMQRIETLRLAALVKMLNDDNLWKMSQNPAFVAEGEAVFKATCASCHGPNLKGKDDGASFIGANLTDTAWLHGGKPIEVFNTVKAGVPAKGMPTWGPLLGDDKVAKVVAFVLNHHRAGETITVELPK